MVRPRLIVICGNHDDKTIAHALHMANHRDLQKWEKDNVPYTMRKKRQEFLVNVKSRNRENYVDHMGGDFDSLEASPLFGDIIWKTPHTLGFFGKPNYAIHLLYVFKCNTYST